MKKPRVAGRGLSERELKRLFPFFIALDSRLNLLAVGPSLRRAVRGWRVGTNVGSKLRFLRPSVADLSDVREQQDQLWLLELSHSTRSGLPLLLRGQLKVQRDRLLFLVSPWFNDVSQLEHLGLSLADFAIHDPLLDFLQLLHAKNAAVLELQAMAQRQSRQRDELRKAHQRLQQSSQVTELLADAQGTTTDKVTRLLEMLAQWYGWDIAILWMEDAPAIRWSRWEWRHFAESLQPPATLAAPVRWTHLAEAGSPRARLSLEAGLRTTVRIPVQGESGSGIGMLEFAAARTTREDPVTLQELEGAGRKLALCLTRARAQEEMHRAREAAEHAARSKSEFLATMSHEIRTPLNGMMGLTGLVLQTQLTPLQREYLTTARGCTDALLVIIDDILDFSRIEAGKLRLERLPFSLWDCVGESVAPLVPKAHQQGVELVLDLPLDLPRVQGDPHRLKQILWNLVSNALKFTPQGRIQVTLARAGEHRVRFEVRDTGLGIDPLHQQRIFQAFVQAESGITRKFGGTGLGLSICSRLVALMGGQIELASEPGQGSRFFFTLDLESAGPETIPALLAGRRVLLCEPNRDRRRHLLEVCLHAGLEVQLGLHTELPCWDGDLAIVNASLGGQSGRCPTLLVAPPGTTLEAGPGQRVLSYPVLAPRLWDYLGKLLEPPEAAPEQNEVAQARPLRILVAEDNKVNQMMVERMLANAGHQATCVSNGRLALEALERSTYDLVLLDIQMPEMDGLEAARAIRSRWGSGLPLIALTAQAMQGDGDRCFDAGMDAYVTKPVTPEQLVGVLSRYNSQATAA